MAGQVPQKIVLKSTTKISLNERFSHIAAQRPQPPPGGSTSQQQQTRSQLAAQQQATAKNRRLALQMANRPAVQAALRLKKRSLSQRLGSDVRARLSLRGARGMRGIPRGRGRGMSRGGFGGSQVSLSSIGSSASNVTRGRGFRGRGFQQRGQVRGQFVGRGRAMVRGAGGLRGRGASRGVGLRIRGGVRGMRRGMRGGAGRGFQQRGRGGRGGGRGRGGASSFTREQLDDQLEEYMSKTKNHLDSELDQYMADN